MLMVRRLAVLLAFGVTHLFLIWNGDILTEYAMVGFAVLPFLYGPRWLLAVMAALSLGVFVAMPLLPPVVILSRQLVDHQNTLARPNEPMAAAASSTSWRSAIDEVRAIAPLHVYALPRTFGLFLLGALAWRTDESFARPLSSDDRSRPQPA